MFLILGVGVLSLLALSRADCFGCVSSCKLKAQQSGPSAVPHCNEGWECYEEKCYKLLFPVTSLSPAVDTKALCVPEGAHAASITSQAQNEWIVEFALKAFEVVGKKPAGGGAGGLLLGTHLQEDEVNLSWDATGVGAACPLTYTNWAPNEPSNVFANMKWGSLLFNLDEFELGSGAWKKGHWNDAWDTYESETPALCVKAAVGAPPNAAACDYKPKPLGGSSCANCTCRENCGSECGL